MNLGFGIKLATLPPLRGGRRDDPAVVVRLGRRDEIAYRATRWSRTINADAVGNNVTFTTTSTGDLTIHLTRLEAGEPFVFHGFTVNERWPRQARGRYDLRYESMELWVARR